MKKFASFILAGMVLAGCTQLPAKNQVTVQDIQHHRFVLQHVDGNPLTLREGGRIPELSFGEKMHLSGAMCNRFMGQATLKGDILQAKGLGMTRMLCADPELNQLDRTLSGMLGTGAKITLTNQQLILSNDQHSLTYKLADLVN